MECRLVEAALGGLAQGTHFTHEHRYQEQAPPGSKACPVSWGFHQNRLVH